MKFRPCLTSVVFSSDWTERNDDFFDGINLDVNFPVVPQEKLAYFREFSLVKLLKSPLNLLFDESIDGYTKRRGRKTQRKLRDSRIIRGAEQTEWKTTEGKSFSWNGFERRISVTWRCCGLELALFSTPEFRWRMWYDRIIRSIDVHSGNFLNQLNLAQPEFHQFHFRFTY